MKLYNVNRMKKKKKKFKHESPLLTPSKHYHHWGMKTYKWDHMNLHKLATNSPKCKTLELQCTYELLWDCVDTFKECTDRMLIISYQT